MTQMLDARSTKLKVIYSGKDISKDIAPFILDFSFSDSSKGQADDLQIILEDSQELWQRDWVPQKGDKVQVELTAINWEGDDKTQTLSCGELEVDETSLGGPPDVFNLKSVSVPVSSSLRGEKKTRAWEAIRLSSIAQDIADDNKMKLMFECRDDPYHKRAEQVEKSDLEFLQNLCERNGLCLKVTNYEIVIFDEQDYEAQKPKATIKKRGSTVLKYHFSSSARDCYSACKVTYFNVEQNKSLTYTFNPKNPPATGQVLTLNEQVDNEEEAERLAKKRLRQKNRNEHRANFTLIGDVGLAAGLTLILDGWGSYDGKYMIDQAKHSYNSSGYKVNLEMHKTLEGY